jgi:hypothetical protein
MTPGSQLWKPDAWNTPSERQQRSSSIPVTWRWNVFPWESHGSCYCKLWQNEFPPPPFPKEKQLTLDFDHPKPALLWHPPCICKTSPVLSVVFFSPLARTAKCTHHSTCSSPCGHYLATHHHHSSFPSARSGPPTGALIPVAPSGSHN